MCLVFRDPKGTMQEVQVFLNIGGVYLLPYGIRGQTQLCYTCSFFVGLHFKYTTIGLKVLAVFQS